MIRLAGGLLIVCSCSAMGWLKARELTERVAQLEQLELAVRLLQVETGFSQTLLPEVLLKISRELQAPVASLFARTGKKLKSKQKIYFYQVWKQELMDSQKYMSLQETDLQFLKEWGVRTGSCSQTEQGKSIS